MTRAGDTGPLTLVCADFNAALDQLRTLGMRLDAIYPADEPHTAILTHGGKVVRLTARADAPGPSADLPPFEPQFVLSPAGGSAAEGRSGMLYRDLIPGRLGGRYVASLITIADAGPVQDWVHFHRVAFQMIYVRSGWVRVVYEDQGEPFVMQAGDLVLQPPQIRHRVLESAAGTEVIEVGCPALHETLADHDLALPNRDRNPTRSFAGQHFLRHVAAETAWTPFGEWEAQETAMGEATNGLAQVRTIRSRGGPAMTFPDHDGELVFCFVLDGAARLDFRGSRPLTAADAFVIPPGEPWTIADAADDFRLLQVTTVRLSRNFA